MKYFSMFSGIGGFEYGIEQAYLYQYEPKNSKQTNSTSRRKRDISEQQICVLSTNNAPLCVGFSEIDKYAIQIYKKHFPKHKEYGDARRIIPEEITDFDLFVGGFPCQSFSIAGKRGGFKDTRGTLFFEIARIISIKRPKLLLLENVKGLLSHDKGRTFGTILTTLSELGYVCEWQILNSKNFGVPQNRERVFIIGHFGGISKQTIFPIRENDKTYNNQEPSQNSCLKSPLRASDDKAMIEITKDVSDAQRIYDSEGIARTLKGESGGQGGKTGLYAIPVLTPNRAEKHQNGRRFKKNGDPSFTLTGQDIHGIMVNSKIRRLTPTECERLQGFDKIEKNVIIKVCLDHQKKNVNVETQNLKLLNVVGNVGKINIKEIVLSVENNLDLKHPLINKLAQQNVLINCEESKVEILNQGKLLLSANSVVKKNPFPHQISIEDFAHLNAGLLSILGKETVNGEEELHQKEQCLIHQKNGEKLVRLFGKEIMQLANAVEKDLITHRKLLKSIISNPLNIESSEQKLTILCLYVINAIIGYIPKETLNQDTFTIIINSKFGWTFGISNSQRYKCLGNAVTTNVVKAIMERALNI